MSGTEFEESLENSANMEMRLITLELMKLAAKERKSFQEVAKKYIKNVYLLSSMLQDEKGQV
ncbi:hypothetical protein KJ780_03980 [Candidatus Micrarchaeota archaeon]|nr:hypothetical protein [Candidatus Micrarchaeota archaeon]